MRAAELTREVRRRALDEGFDLVAVVRADRPARDAAALDAWLRRDYHAAMSWMARSSGTRADPAVLLPGCRTIVAVSMRYGGGPDSHPGRGKIARYARGRDYHKVLGARLRRLAAWLAEASGAPARACVDTAPVLERAHAQRAGLGWIGKNACLIHRTLGSWTVLGEVLTAAELEPDASAHGEFCGTCTACLDICPTGALVAPGVLDARRCISYWTIEHRGSTPAQLRGRFGSWMFGCDDCQTVCPWNRADAARAAAPALSRRDDLEAGLDAAEVLAMDEAEFRARFSGTPLMRARWDGMRRNACIVLGNRADPRDAAILARVLRDGPEGTIRAHAAWALGRIGATGRLRGSLRRERDPEVIREIRDALAVGRAQVADPKRAT